MNDMSERFLEYQLTNERCDADKGGRERISNLCRLTP